MSCPLLCTVSLGPGPLRVLVRTPGRATGVRYVKAALGGPTHWRLSLCRRRVLLSGAWTRAGS